MPTTDADARTLMIDSARMLLTELTADFEHIATNNFSDDDTDYFPARAATYSNLMAYLVMIPHDMTALEALTSMLADESMLEDATTCDDHTPICALACAIAYPEDAE